MPSDEAQFKERVYAFVAQIPKGKVMTYGQLAALAGNARAARIVGGIAHFGFRLRSPDAIAAMEKNILEAGGVINNKGEFIPGSPFIFFQDPDGYEVEVWYEVI